MVKDKEIDAMVAALDVPPSKPPAPSKRDWYPDLNPTQRELFESPAKFLLAYGEKGSG